MPGKSWNDLIGDAKAYPDDTQITLADGTAVKLGDLRTLTKAEQDQFKTREDKLKADMQVLEKDHKELEQAQQEVARLFAELQEKATVEGAHLPKPKEGEPLDYERDTYVGPLFKQLQALQESLKKQEDSYKVLQRDLLGTRVLYENDRLYGQYESLPAEGRPPFDEMLKAAAEQNLKDKFGRLDLRQLHSRLSEPGRLKQLEKEAEGRGYKRGKEETETSLIPRPGAPGRALGVKPKFKNIDEALAAAAQDPEIVRGLYGIPAPEQQQ